MAHIRSHTNGTDEAPNTFLVVFKVHGDAIHLWPQDKMQAVGKTHKFRISCNNVETHCEHPGSDIKVILLKEPAVQESDSCEFLEQQPDGLFIGCKDLAMFMTGPVPSSRKASYAINVGLSKHHGSSTTIKASSDASTEHFEKVGSAYVYLDPKFSSQGIQRTPIIATHNHVPIGQLQIEYLIVTHPEAYDLPSPRPDWLFKSKPIDAGHRGAGSGRRMELPEELLENTVASFNYAHRHGADACELDVVLSADGIPVVYHDFDVDAVAAQQKKDELGKFRVQVNEFTVKQLRDFQLLALHDGENCPYTLNVPNQAESNRPFPTLAEVLDQVDVTCSLNIEIKWPQQLESGRMEARKYREINDFVDRIIKVVHDHAGERRIVLESFDADIVILLRMKQNKFPVIFLNQGLTDQYERYSDIRARSVINGVYFAQAFKLAGLDIILDYYMSSGKKLVDFINDHELVARAWGNIGEGSTTIDFLKDIGVQCITYDKIDLVKKDMVSPTDNHAKAQNNDSKMPSYEKDLDVSRNLNDQFKKSQNVMVA